MIAPAGQFVHDKKDELKVSVWLGHFETKEAFIDYVKPQKSSDGEEYSQFSMDLGEISYDRIQIMYHKDEMKSVSQLFRNIKNSVSIVTEILERNIQINPKEYNATICMFDYVPGLHPEKMTEEVDFIGSIDYNPYALQYT